MNGIGNQISDLRRASRETVRELGMLTDGRKHFGVTPAQCHTLIELDSHGTLGAQELAERLQVDKSAMSRTVATLIERGLIAPQVDPRDRRRKPLALTPAGQKKLAKINEQANARVQEALSLLSDEARDRVIGGMAEYARALTRARRLRDFTIRPIRAADDPAVAQVIRSSMMEFGADGPGFAIHDPEVAAMSRAYRGRGAKYFAVDGPDGQVVGGAGFGPLEGGPDDTCELRKMYLRADARGTGLGRKLLGHVLEAAAAAGYRRCYLETLEHMSRARALYRASGFEDLQAPLGQTGHFGCNRWMARGLGPGSGADDGGPAE